MLTFKNLRLAYGSKVLFAEASLQLYVGQKIGLVGQNGCGKTSLFKLILGQNNADIGDFTITKDAHIAYVEQEIADSEVAITQYVLNAHPLIIDDHTDLPEYYQLQPRAEKLLISLGFKQDELYLPLKSFSGGWQMRANLAKALFVPSDLLLLDEPTNHLDIETVIWLEDWLKNYSGLVIIISHDREFLDNVTNYTLSLRKQRLTLYNGNYSNFERIYTQQLLQQQQLQAKNKARVQHLQSFVDRFRAKASKAKQAQSRVKMIEKIQIAQSMPRDIEYNICFLEPSYQVDKLITIASAKIGYNDKILIDQAKLDIFQNSRIGLLGRNGVGKSSFIKACIDGNTLISGLREVNSKIKIGYFAQHTVDGLDTTITPLTFFKHEHKEKKEQELRTYLGGYGFSGDKVNEIISNFSGGEKARLVIANIILHRPNIIFLDEPTNHLDIQMREELASSIQDFSGAIVIVSHDKFLLQSVVDEFYLINEQKLSPFAGDLDDYHNFLLKQKDDKTTHIKAANSNAATNNSNKTSSLLKHDLKKLEIKIATIEKKIVGIEEQLSKCNDRLQIEQLNHDYAKTKNILDTLETKWLELNHE